ncbi:three-Cys-motif partner protein TcmP [Sphingomonas sp. JC676]|uniref:three-Cys-motif partner protein TcmP n=1 Tax=Sphingomonas sp. JC676 TaxID=2768065 RepID=UPI0016581A39|nr:three-Cys-motif partner protein TcmP [Sphingomonas sp. JC676]MBC9034683.1 three-Cys-motif partner protein TcmP [Sphingomonas sp. JC676]
MVAQAFGDEHTRRKLETVEKYLAAYTTALKLQDFELLYVDACAGSGASIPRSALADREAKDNGQTYLLDSNQAVADADQIIVGSALRALKVGPSFDRYLLNDVKKSNVDALRAAVSSDFQHLTDRIQITKFDANEMLLDLCKRTNWKATRAVVFLDPFGLQIKFSTLEALARTCAVDVWYLVPVFAMYRQIRHDGEVLEDGGRSVDEALGTTEWRNVVAVEEKGQIDLWGASQPVSRRAVDVKWFETVAKERLKHAFQGRVIDQVLPLGRNGLHEFSLMFAWANPSERAKLASKLASAVLR